MHPADEYARLKSEIRVLEARAKALRDRFVLGRAPCVSNAVEVVVENRTRRVFLRDKLPREILADPSYWAEMPAQRVTFRENAPDAVAEDFEVIDSW